MRTKNIELADPSMQEKPITIELSEDNEDYPKGLKSLAREICDIIQEQYDQRQQQIADVIDYRLQYESRTNSSPSYGPFRGAANVHTPMTHNGVDTMVAQVMRVCTGIEPYFKVTSRKPDRDDMVRKVEDFLQFQLQDDIKFRSKLRPIVRRSFIDGSVLGKTRQRYEYATRRDKRKLDDDLLSQMGNQYRTAVNSAKKDNANIVVEKGNKRYKRGDEVEVDITDCSKNHPDLEWFPIEDAVVFPVTATLDKAIMVGNRSYQTKNDLLRGVRDGRYDKDAVDEVLKASPGQWIDFMGRYGGDMAKWEEMGLSPNASNYSKHDPYETYEVVYEFDYNGDGIAEDCLFTVDFGSETILRAMPLPYWDGDRHYLMYTPFPRDDSAFGYALPDILQQIQDIHNQSVNQVLDAGTLANSPIITVLDTSETSLTKTRLRTGEVFKVRDQNEIKVTPIYTTPPTGFMDISLVERMGAEASGVTDTASGQPSQSARPLGETQAVLEQAGFKFQVIIDNIQDTNALLCNQIIGLNRQYMDGATEYAITGSKGRIFDTITPEELRTGLTILAHGNTINTNREQEMVASEKLVLSVERCPLMQKPSRIWEVYARFLYAHGYKNYENFIGSKADALKADDAPSPQPPPQISAAIKLEGIPALAKMIETDPGFVSALAQAEQIDAKMNLDSSGVKAAADAQTAQIEAKKQELRNEATMADTRTRHAMDAANLSTQHNSDMARAQIEAHKQSATFAVMQALQSAQHKHALALSGVKQGVQTTVQQGTNQLALAAQKAQQAKANATKRPSTGTH